MRQQLAQHKRRSRHLNLGELDVESASVGMSIRPSYVSAADGLKVTARKLASHAIAVGDEHAMAASTASDYVTDQNLVVDGGSTLYRRMLPLECSVPPRVDSVSEVLEVNRVLDNQGIVHDEDGIVLVEYVR